MTDAIPPRVRRSILRSLLAAQAGLGDRDRLLQVRRSAHRAGCGVARRRRSRRSTAGSRSCAHRSRCAEPGRPRRLGDARERLRRRALVADGAARVAMESIALQRRRAVRAAARPRLRAARRAAAHIPQRGSRTCPPTTPPRKATSRARRASTRSSRSSRTAAPSPCSAPTSSKRSRCRTCRAAERAMFTSGLPAARAAIEDYVALARSARRAQLASGAVTARSFRLGASSTREVRVRHPIRRYGRGVVRPRARREGRCCSTRMACSPICCGRSTSRTMPHRTTRSTRSAASSRGSPTSMCRRASSCAEIETADSRARALGARARLARARPDQAACRPRDAAAQARHRGRQHRLRRGRTTPVRRPTTTSRRSTTCRPSAPRAGCASTTAGCCPC